MVYLLLNVLKLLYIGQAFNQIRVYIFGMRRVFLGMAFYTILMVFISFVFSILYMGAQIDEPGGDDHTKEDDFPGLPVWAKFLLYGLSNTLGDFEKPEYSRWPIKDDAHNPYRNYFMISLGLAINYSQAIVMVIVLLNLLISIISDEHEKSMNAEVEAEY